MQIKKDEDTYSDIAYRKVNTKQAKVGFAAMIARSKHPRRRSRKKMASLCIGSIMM